jgi:hypothetical protein
MATTELLIDAEATDANGNIVIASTVVTVQVPDARGVRADSLPGGHAAGEPAPLPGRHALAPGDPGYSPRAEQSRQTWSGWASR